MNYEEIGFQANWENRTYLINGEWWYCYYASPRRFCLTKGTHHQQTNIHADFDPYSGNDWELEKAVAAGKDISHLGNFYSRK